MRYAPAAGSFWWGFWAVRAANCGTVLFPGLVLSLAVGRPKSIATVQQEVREERQIGVLLQRNGEINDPGPDDLYRIGTLANILRYVTTPDGTHHIVVQGVHRILDFYPGTLFPAARAVHISEPDARSPVNEYYLARLAELARSHRIALHYLAMPMNAGVRQPPEAYFQRFAGIVERSGFAGCFSGVRFWPNALYWDAAHLNETGAARLNQELATGVRYCQPAG